MMEQLVKQQMAVRTWRPALAEAFEDQRFFARDVAAGLRWCPLIRAYVLSDKLAIPDIVGEFKAANPINALTLTGTHQQAALRPPHLITFSPIAKRRL